MTPEFNIVLLCAKTDHAIASRAQQSKICILDCFTSFAMTELKKNYLNNIRKNRMTLNMIQIASITTPSAII